MKKNKLLWTMLALCAANFAAQLCVYPARNGADALGSERSGGRLGCQVAGSNIGAFAVWHRAADAGGAQNGPQARKLCTL